MSIINDTLKALDKKQQQSSGTMSADAAAQLSQGTTTRTSSIRRTLYLLVGVGCISVISIGTAIVIKLTRHTTPTQKVISTKPTKSLSTAEALTEKPMPSSPATNPKTAEPFPNKFILTAATPKPAMSSAASLPSQVYQANKSHTNSSSDQSAFTNNQQPQPKKNHLLVQRDTQAITQQALEAVNANDNGRLQILTHRLLGNQDWEKMVKGVINHLTESNEYVAAERLLKNLSRYKPNSIPLRTITARLYIKEGNILKGINFLQERHVPIQKNTEYYALLAYAYLQESDYRDSVALYQQLVSIDSTQASWWMGLGVGYLSGGNKSMALKSFEEAFSHSKPHAPYRYFLKQKIASLQQEKA